MSAKQSNDPGNLGDVLDFIKSLENMGLGNQGSINSETEHLIPKRKDTVISLSDSDSADSEFGDIIQRRSKKSHHEERSVTNSGTVLHLLKANISTGLLAMPKAMSHFGLLAGILGILIIGSMYIYCIHLLLEINRAVVRRVKLDRLIQDIKTTVFQLAKKAKKENKKELKRNMAKKAKKKTKKKLRWNKKRVAKYNKKEAFFDCVSVTEKTSTKPKNWVAKFAADLEVGESSSSKQDESNKKPKNWKKQFEADIEVGESSSSKQDDSNKNFIKLKETEVDIEQGRPSALKQEDPNVNAAMRNKNETGIKSGTSEQEDPDKITELEVSVAKDAKPEVPSASNQDQAKKDSQEQDNENPDIKYLEAEVVRTLDYPKLVELSFHYGMPSTKYASKVFKFYVQVLMLLTHIGCCCVCFLFVAETLAEISTDGKFIFHSNSFQMVAYGVPVMICLSYIPHRHELTGVTTIAFLLQLCGVLMMLYFFFQGEHNGSLNLYIAPAETWYLYFGIIFYAFEGTGVTLHLESHMEKKQDFRGWNGIFNKSMFFVIPLFAVFGALGYWKFGDDVKTSVTFNLPEERFTDLIQFMTALGILLTYPFHLSFVLAPIQKLVIQDDFTDRTKNAWDLVIRSAFVIFTFVMSALIPYLELQLTVLGALASCFLILVIPPFMSLNSYYYLPDLNYSCCRLLVHAFIMVVGTAGTLLGSYITFKNMHLYYPNSTIFG